MSALFYGFTIRVKLEEDFLYVNLIIYTCSKMTKGYEMKGDAIVINRDLTELDLFVKKFIDTLKKHANYLIVSGFVSIATGRTRGTEDVDILTMITSKDTFDSLFTDLLKNGFWCYQSDTAEGAYAYFENLQNIRFAKSGEMFPNVELIPINKEKKAKFFEFTHPQRMIIKDFEFKIPPIEFEILYKELVLRGKKDIDDARHLRTFFSDIIKEEKFKNYREIVMSEIK